MCGKLLRSLTIVLSLCLLSASTAHAQNADWLRGQIIGATKNLMHSRLSKADCAKISMNRIEACQAFGQKMFDARAEVLQILYNWQKALEENNRQKLFEERLNYNRATLKQLELDRQSWFESFFGGKWDAHINGRRSSILEGYKGIQQTYVDLRDNVCKILPVNKEECSKEFGDYVGAIQNIISWGEKLNQAYDANDRDQFFTAVIGEQRALVRAVEIEGRLKQKYLP